MFVKAISIFGIGRVGLCTAVCFANKGIRVIGVDIDPEKVKAINQGRSPFYEPDLRELLESVRKRDFFCTTDQRLAVKETDISFITVGTPSKPNGNINLQHVETASRNIGEALKDKPGYHLIVIKSTVPPGTSESVIKPIIENHSGKRCSVGFGLCMNPEFLSEGSTIHDTLHPDRIIIGEHDRRSGDILESLYQQFYGEQLPPLIRTNLPTAEFIKYANNAFLAMKVSFINTMANVCERIAGVNVKELARGIGLDKRIGQSFLNAGLGYGGSCLPRDTRTLISFSTALGYNPVLIKAVEAVNNLQPYKAIELARKLIGDVKDRRVAVLGLTFKPNTNDMREAVSIKIINNLLEDGAKIVVYDPVAIAEAKKIFRDKVHYASSSIDCLKGTDCCIIVTEWDEFKNLKPEDFLENMRAPSLVDGRCIYDPAEYSRRLKYAAIGIG